MYGCNTVTEFKVNLLIIRKSSLKLIQIMLLVCHFSMFFNETNCKRLIGLFRIQLLSFFPKPYRLTRGANPVSSLGDKRSNLTKICNLTSLGYDFSIK